MVQVVADFVDGAVFGLVEGAVGVEGVWWRMSLDGCSILARDNALLHTFFEEESHLVAAFQEVAVAYMITLLACGELGHGVVIEGEVVQ